MVSCDVNDDGVLHSMMYFMAMMSLLLRTSGVLTHVHWLTHAHPHTHTQPKHTHTHTTAHSALCFHWHHGASPLLPSLRRSSLRWPVSRLMADLRYTTWTRPFTSTSCWPLSSGSMKNSPLSVRIRPAWKRQHQISATLLFQRMVIPLEPVIIVCLINWKI